MMQGQVCTDHQTHWNACICMLLTLVATYESTQGFSYESLFLLRPETYILQQPHTHELKTSYKKADKTQCFDFLRLFATLQLHRENCYCDYKGREIEHIY